MRAGKAVYVEKPMAATYAECQQMLLDNERAGDSWRVDPKVAGGGLLYDLASHQLDLVSFLFGKILEASGSSANFGGRYAAEDTQLLFSMKRENRFCPSPIRKTFSII